jgi:hypothetical protein
MKKSKMKPELLGYALNALEPDELRAVEQHLAESPEARAELAAIQAAISPLVHDAEIEAPPQLLGDTLQRIAAFRCRPIPETLPSPPMPIKHAKPRRTVGFSWRHADALIAASIVLILCMMIPPALMYARHREEVMACADNLHQFHDALSLYSQDQNGYLPRPEKSGPLSAAAVYPVALREKGYWGSALHTTCPANRRSGQDLPPPDLRQFQVVCIQSDRESRRQLYETLGGCYGYHLGYEDENGQFMAIRRTMDGNIPIMADRPPRERETPAWQSLNSPNHYGLGQNVLYLGGHVRFERRRMIGEDDIFLNAGRRLAVGHGPRDAVLGPGEARPYPDQDQ